MNIEAMADRIEILSVDLLENQRIQVESFQQLAIKLGIELGWHYLLDLTWIATHLEGLEGSKILDAGAGTGVMQWWLASHGAHVVSVDRTSRVELSARFRLGYRVEGLRSEDLYDPKAMFMRRLRDNSHSYRRRLTGAVRMAGAALLIPFSPKARGKVVVYNHDLTTMTDLEDDSFDYVIAVSSLEHNHPEQLSKVVKEIMRVLKPGGSLLATLPAAGDQDWFHEPSKGWCYTEDSLRRAFNLPTSAPSNYQDYEGLFERLRTCDELQQNLSPFYFRSGDNGMPWGVWDPQYQPIGILKRRAHVNEKIEFEREAG